MSQHVEPAAPTAETVPGEEEERARALAARADRIAGLRTRLETTLAAALADLLTEAERAGHWGDVRGTSDALIALGHCLPDDAFERLRAHAAGWLVARMEPGDEGTCWEEEVWDTSVAVAALATRRQRHLGAIDSALGWLRARCDHGKANWNDEPWETSWALVALHAARTAGGQTELRPEGALRWLVDLAARSPDGLFINLHYTGLLLLVALRYPTPIIQERSAQCLLLALRQPGDAATLLTRELWSNSLAVWALAEARAFHGDPRSLDAIDRIVTWFQRALARGNDVPTEDRAFACIALFHLQVCLESVKTFALEERAEGLREGLDGPVRALVDDCVAVVSALEGGGLQERLAAKLVGTVRDYAPSPPFLGDGYHDGYYTMNLPKRATNVALIAAATAVLTIGSVNAASWIGGTWGHVLSWVPITLGVLATIAQLANFSLRDAFRRRRGRVDGATK